MELNGEFSKEKIQTFKAVLNISNHQENRN